MSSTSISEDIYLSRDEIRLQIIEYMKTYMELENIDLTKSSFLSFLINTLSTLTSNLLFYETSVYREFFLTKAMLSESILNLSSFLGYNTKEASYATANVLFTIPLTFTSYPITLTIPNGSLTTSDFKLTSGIIDFVTYYVTTIEITNASSVSITVTTSDNRTFNLPFTIENGSLEFILPVRQYKVTTIERQVDSDLQALQFFTLDVPLNGKVSSMSVSVGGTSYTEYSSLYLMGSDTKGYVSRRTSTGIKLYFGNGLVGFQPPSGETILITLYETEGATGNVIASSINTGTRLYVTDNGQSKQLDYTITNTSAATGGEDEETDQEIRTNSIANLVSMGRLVGEQDFQNIDVVVPYSPLSQNSYPILKRSDFVRNEISLFTTLMFDSELVPMRNAKLILDSETTSVNKGYSTTIDGTEYETLFNMTIDSTNRSATYTYNLSQITLNPILSKNYSTEYITSLNNLNITHSGNITTFSMDYEYSSNIDPSLLSGELYNLTNSRDYDMVNDSTAYTFTYIFNTYPYFPGDEQNLLFKIYYNGTMICDYIVSTTVKKVLDEFMLSSIAVDSTGITIYDVPVIKSSYLSAIDVDSFELDTLQYMLSTLSFENYRMITDFVNLKFTNTSGSMLGMQYNDVTKEAVIQIGIPNTPINAGRYIVSGSESVSWKQYEGKIATYDSGTDTWTFTTPQMDDIVKVTNENKKYIYSEKTWVYPNYTIPLEIEIEVFKSSTYYGTNAELTNAIKEAIYEAFENRFGSNISLYRSEIIDVAHNVSGVRNVNIVKPESNIFFDFETKNLTKTELLEFSPEYVYFTEDNITVRIY